MIAGVETGGTKIVCAVADDRSVAHPVAVERFPTREAARSIPRIARSIRAACAGRPLRAVGVAGFGPINADPTSPDYGRVGTTPKPGWQGVNVRRELAAAVGAPVAVVSDVTGAGLAEFEEALTGRGALTPSDTLAYMTVGTGVGIGVIHRGQPFGGADYPELGHICVAPAPGDAEFPGVCRRHGRCLEGLASGPAILARWGRPLSEDADAAHAETIAHYLAQGLLTVAYAFGPKRIVVGGGVLHTPGLLHRIARRFFALKGGEGAEGYGVSLTHADLTPPALGDRAGVTGALLLARRLLD